MKKLLLLLCIALFTALSTASAQSAADVDPRIRIHYTENEVNEMLSQIPVKIKQLNYYFRSSYVVINGAGPVMTASQLQQFDVKQYEHLRKENSRVRVGIDRTSGTSIELLSLNELKEQYILIANQQ